MLYEGMQCVSQHPSIYICVGFYATDPVPHSTDEYTIMKSLLEYIPYFICRDPQLAKAILMWNHSYVTTLALLAIREKYQDKRRKECRWWVRPYLLRRRNFGHYDNLMQELAQEDPVLNKNFMRLGEDLFNEIVEWVRPHIEKKTTWWRKPLDVGLRVTIS